MSPAPSTDAATSQLADELRNLWEALEVLDFRAATHLGTTPYLGGVPSDQAGHIAPVLIAQVTSHHRTIASETAQALLLALYPPTGRPPHDWWTTDLGRLTAGALAPVTPETEVVTVAEADLMLGHRGRRAAQLLTAGALEEGPPPEGASRSTTRGVTLRSIFHRLAEAPGSGWSGWTEKSKAAWTGRARGGWPARTGDG